MNDHDRRKLCDLLMQVASVRTAPPRDEVVTAIRTLESRLHATLAGYPLRSLPNLATKATPLYGANVRAHAYNDAIAFPATNRDVGPEVLVLRPDGKLALAWAHRSALTSPEDRLRFAFTWRGAHDDDIQVEDLPRVLRVLPVVLSNHLAAVERTSASWDALRDLAHRVLDLIPRKEAS